MLYIPFKHTLAIHQDEIISWAIKQSLILKEKKNAKYALLIIFKKKEISNKTEINIQLLEFKQHTTE